MTDRAAETPGGAARRTFYTLGSVGLVVAGLYLGRNLIVPLALALLLTLVLGPVVVWLERRGMRRFLAVVSTAFLALVLIALAGWAVTVQVTSLMADLPGLRTKLREKLVALRAEGKRPGPVSAVRDLIEEVEKASQPEEPAPGAGPVVRAVPAKPSPLAQMQPVLGRAMGVVSAMLALILLVIALLLNREDTRNRLIRLAGRGRLTVTTRALDEAGRRLGGYLLGHSAVNAGYGMTIGLGLAALGVPYPALWGLLAGAFRFVPGIGIWLVAPLPTALAYVGDTAHPVLVLALFGALELLTVTQIEPRVAGRSVGLAKVPLYLAITFWTGLWGVVGLVLATPVTVCLAVLGKYVPQLQFLSVLLGQESVLRPAARYYQRLLARDRFEAESVVKEYLADHSVESLFDQVLVPALVLVRRGRKTGELQPEDEEHILRTTREVVAGLGAPDAGDGPPDGRQVVLGVPSADGADETVLLMLRHLTRSSGADVEVAAGGTVAAGLTREAAPAAVLIAAVGPGGLTEARYLCRRIRAQCPSTTIVVGRFGKRTGPGKARALLQAAGADRVVGTLAEARAHLTRLGPRGLADTAAPAVRPSVVAAGINLPGESGV